jgi:hypothetical protein
MRDQGLALEHITLTSLYFQEFRSCGDVGRQAMTDASTASLITASASLIVALVAGGIALWNSSKVSENAVVIQDVKSGIDRDLERLKAKLEHGQLISSTQWNAEFNALQALWKSMVPVRSLARKIVLREGELVVLGLEAGDVSEEAKIEIFKRLLEQYTQAAQQCMLAINEHAPFYTADIRKKANEVHGLAHVVLKTSLAGFVARAKGKSLPTDQTIIADEERRKELTALMSGVDSIEEMIRKRLNEVQVLNLVTA